MFPAVYNANMRIIQSPGFVAISYELIHDTRVIALDASQRPAPFLSSAIRTYMGIARGRWEGTTLVVESGNFRAGTRGASAGLRLIERFTRTGRGAMQCPGDLHRSATWTAPWTAALDLKSRPAGSAYSSTPATKGTMGCPTCSPLRVTSSGRLAKTNRAGPHQRGDRIAGWRRRASIHCAARTSTTMPLLSAKRMTSGSSGAGSVRAPRSRSRVSSARRSKGATVTA